MSILPASQLGLALLIALAGCAPATEDRESAASVEPSAGDVGSPTPSEPAASFPTAAFADISEDRVSQKVTAKFQAVLHEMAGGAGMAATVMSADGTWSGAVGKADRLRDVRVNDQFAIGSVTKSVVAAQVMQIVEAGELALDDPAADHLPADLEFDTIREEDVQGATIRQLLGHRTGGEFHYSPTNYVLLGLIIEQVRGRPVADVLRDGVLSIDGVERLIYQPDEVPTEPMAMPYGESTALEEGGGYLPSLAGATDAGPAGAMASDSPSLARWWRALCAGEIVSQASLTEMTTFQDGYGLGLYDAARPYADAVGHAGEHVGYVAWAGCLPEDGSVVVVLSNRVVEDISGMARPLVEAASSD